MAAMTLAVLAGCGSSSSAGSGAPAATGPSQAEEDRKDTRAIESQVNQQISDRAQSEAAAQGDFVEASTGCTKQSDTAYKCITSFSSPTGYPEVVTDVTCDRNGGSCITETR
jgi:hypothetical protein